MNATFGTAFVSSYPPRACGIATFTRDLSEAVAQSGRGVVARVAAINDEGAIYSYPQQVRWSIDQGDPQSWIDVAAQINRSRVSLVSIQHEFGLYGRFERNGNYVDYLDGFLDRLEKPVVSTLHTVLPHPRSDLKAAVKSLHDRSAAVITMVNMARLILEQEYGLDPAKLVTIPHGVPEVRQTQPDRIKRAMQLEGRTILSTFGLLSSGKGIQYVIRALPEVVKRHPEVLYLVLGETHPEVRRHEGEKYRNSLIDLIKKLHLEKHVRFVNLYLTQQQLIRYLQATDIYITPYVDRYQITSGTLAYAIGCGKAIISTPYLYASEALAEGRGVLAEFQDPMSFARCINMLLENGAMREQCETRAFEYGRAMSWGTVGAHYADLFRSLVHSTPDARPVRDLVLLPAAAPSGAQGDAILSVVPAASPGQADADLPTAAKIRMVVGTATSDPPVPSLQLLDQRAADHDDRQAAADTPSLPLYEVPPAEVTFPERVDESRPLGPTKVGDGPMRAKYPGSQGGDDESTRRSGTLVPFTPTVRHTQ